jgi:hypothetical protein
MKRKKAIQRLAQEYFDDMDHAFTCLLLSQRIGFIARKEYSSIFCPTEGFYDYYWFKSKTEKKDHRVLMLLFFAELVPAELLESEYV